MRKWGWAIAGVVLFWGFLCVETPLGWAGEPTEALRSGTDRVIEVLRDPQMKTNLDLRDKRIWETISSLFDFEEMSRRALAVHWRDRTPDEQKEFVQLFGRLLQKSYAGKLDQYSDERVEYLSEDLDGPRAEVRTKIASKGTEIPLDYRLLEKSGKWWVYDVVIEGVSLVNNYRNQFNRIVVSSGGYKELVKRLRTKMEDLVKESQKKEST
jgi:phospholipid transport system substrate-binding protein